jgi:hypothetical protein
MLVNQLNAIYPKNKIEIKHNKIVSFKGTNGIKPDIPKVNNIIPDIGLSTFIEEVNKLFEKSNNSNLVIPTNIDGSTDFKAAALRFNEKSNDEKIKLIKTIEEMSTLLESVEPKNKYSINNLRFNHIQNKDELIKDIVSVLYEGKIPLRKSAIKILGEVYNENRTITNVLLSVIHDSLTYKPDAKMTNFDHFTGDIALEALTKTDPETTQKLFEKLAIERYANAICNTDLFSQSADYSKNISKMIKTGKIQVLFDKIGLKQLIQKYKPIFFGQQHELFLQMSHIDRALTIAHNCSKFVDRKEDLSIIIKQCLRK